MKVLFSQTSHWQGRGWWTVRLEKQKQETMKPKLKIQKQWAVALCVAFIATAAQAQDKKPNIVFIMGDDVGWFNVEPYHQGIMSGKTPNLMRLAKEGMRFTDYYAEASCTAGRANFITGELPIRTGLTTVGQAGADVGMPAESPTLATVGPRNLVHSFASDTDDPTEQPRWGKVGKQTISDEGPLPPHPMDGIKY